MATRKSGLGKGLDALFAENTNTTESSSVVLRIAEIEPNKNQPRHNFDENAMMELADSIREVGIIQPLIVRSIAGGGYQIVAGERRWRAAQLAGLEEVPVVIRELTDRELDEFALIENLQREDLDAIEEAEGYRRLMNEYQMTQEQVAERVGKSRPAVANSVRLLELPNDILDLVQQKKLSAGHARALLSLDNDEDMRRIGQMAVKKGMNVREVEKAVKKEKSIQGESAKPKSLISRNTMLDEVELSLSEHLQRRVKVTGNEEKGTLEVDFFSIEELVEMANKLAGNLL